MAASVVAVGLPELPADGLTGPCTESRRFRGSARMTGGGKRVGHAMEPNAGHADGERLVIAGRILDRLL